MDKKFWRLYSLAACVTGLCTFMFVVPAVLLLLLFFLRGKGQGRNKVAFAVSVLFCSVFMLIYTAGLYVLVSVDSLSDFEGSNGEGSPIAPITVMSFFTLFLVIPWTLTVMRGWHAMKVHAQMEKFPHATAP